MFWCVELDLFFLGCRSFSEFWGVYGPDVTLASCILMLRAVFLCCLRSSVELVELALELVGSWVELGFSVGMEAFG